MFTAISIKDIMAKTVKQFDPSVKPLGSHNYVPGQAGYQDLVTATGQGSGDLTKAKKYLTEKFARYLDPKKSIADLD